MRKLNELEMQNVNGGWITVQMYAYAHISYYTSWKDEELRKNVECVMGG